MKIFSFALSFGSGIDDILIVTIWAADIKKAVSVLRNFLRGELSFTIYSVEDNDGVHYSTFSIEKAMLAS